MLLDASLLEQVVKDFGLVLDIVGTDEVSED